MTCRLRPVTDADEPFLFALRIDPEVAQQSAAPAPSREAHAQWFAARPATRLLYIVEDRPDGVTETPWDRAGMIRLDLTPDATAWVSLALCPRARGWGYGREALGLIEAEAAVHGVRTLHAWIKGANTPSLRCFDAAGYHFVGHVATMRFAMKELRVAMKELT